MKHKERLAFQVVTALVTLVGNAAVYAQVSTR